MSVDEWVAHEAPRHIRISETNLCETIATVFRFLIPACIDWYIMSELAMLSLSVKATRQVSLTRSS